MPDQGNIYQKLIVTAKTRLDEQGSLPCSLAELSELAGLGEDEVHNNFASIEDLHEGLIYQGVVLLNDRLRRDVVDAGIESPDAQLRSLARSYTEWAAGNPSLFRLIVDGLNHEMAPDSTLYRFTTSMRDLLARKLTELRSRGQMRSDTDIDAILILMHCLIKGANIVLLTRACDPWLKDDARPTQHIAADMFDYFLDNVLSANAPLLDPARFETEAIRS